MLQRGLERAQELTANKSDDRRFAIQRAAEILRDAGVIDPRLEAAVATDKVIMSEAPPDIDLRQQTYDLLPFVRDPSDGEREALEKIVKGIVFLPLPSETLPQVITKTPNYFWAGALDYVNARTQLRDFVIPAMVVAINPTQLALPHSYNKSRATQLGKIDEYSKFLEAELPDAKAIMLPSAGYALADKVCKEITGEQLFQNSFARALDNIFGVYAAHVGRYSPGGRLAIDGWDVNGGGRVMAVPAIVFLRK